MKTRLELLICGSLSLAATAGHLLIFFPLRAACLLVAALGGAMERWGEVGEYHLDKACQQWRVHMQGSTYDQIKELAEENRTLKEQVRLLKVTETP